MKREENFKQWYKEKDNGFDVLFAKIDAVLDSSFFFWNLALLFFFKC